MKEFEDNGEWFKYCSACNRILPYPDILFDENPKASDKLFYYCRECRVEKNREWREKNPEKVKEHNKQSYRKDAEGKKKRNREYREKHPEYYRDWYKTHRKVIERKPIREVTEKERDYFVKGRLADVWIVPPLSILDSRMSYWLHRKKEWLSLGINDRMGREIQAGDTRENYGKYISEKVKSGGRLSAFDPVIAEVMYKWFCEGDKILDPFAGGSVRGIVAEVLGYNYTGIELRRKQVEANYIQAKEIGVNPNWMVGDSENVLDEVEGEFDFIIGCPPYHNLEVYSNLKGELSNIDTYEDFLVKYKSIIKKSVSKLKDDRFACFVVSNIRDRNIGKYNPLVADTINIFREEGMELYNDLVYIMPVVSAAIRAGRHMKSSRKCEKVHQNVLVFYKGDTRGIKRISMVERCKLC